MKQTSLTHRVVDLFESASDGARSGSGVAVGHVPVSGQGGSLGAFAAAAGVTSPLVPVLWDLAHSEDTCLAGMRGGSTWSGLLRQLADFPRTDEPRWNPDRDTLNREADLTCALLAALQEVRRSVPPEGIDQVDALKTRTLEWMTACLAHDSAVRRSLSDRIVWRAGDSFPWPEVIPPARGLALLYQFAPFQDTGSTVASKRLREFGESVDVIAASFLHHKKQDPTIERISAPYVTSKYFLDVPPSWASWPQFVSFAERAARVANGYLGAPGAVYEFLYTRAMWAPSFYAGALVKRRHPGIRWVAEFSDPLSLDVEGDPRGAPIPIDAFSEPLLTAYRKAVGEAPPDPLTIFSFPEHLAYAFADELIFTNDNQMLTMLERVANAALRRSIEERAVVSNHPTLPRYFYEMAPAFVDVDETQLNLAYFGEFYSSRGLTDVTRAIRSLPARLRDRITLHVFTNYVPESVGGKRSRSFSVKRYSDLVAQAVSGVGAEGIEHLIVFHPSLPFLEFLSATDAFDYLVVTDARSGEKHPVNPYLPSKWSDYAGSEARTWALVEPGSSMARKGGAVYSPLGDVSGAREALWRMLEDKFGQGGEL